MDKFGQSPLLWATTGRHVEVVKVLLQAGASVTSQGNWHALHEACKKGYTELVEMLIDAAAPVNNPVHCKFVPNSIVTAALSLYTQNYHD